VGVGVGEDDDTGSCQREERECVVLGKMDSARHWACGAGVALERVAMQRAKKTAVLY